MLSTATAETQHTIYIITPIDDCSHQRFVVSSSRSIASHTGVNDLVKNLKSNKIFMKTLNKFAKISMAWIVLAPATNAAVLASEDFGYTDGVLLNGQSGGTGWGTAWSATNNPAPEDPRQSYSTPVTYAGYGSGGGYVTYRSDFRNATRTLDTMGTGAFSSYLNGSSDIGLDGTELWFSVVNQRLTNTALNSGDTFRFNLLKDNAEVLRTTQNNLDGNVHLFVIHIQFQAGNDTVTKYFDPDLSIAPTGGIVSSVADASFDAIQFSGNFFGEPDPVIAVDAIRVAENATDIGFAPVPEPSAFALTGLGLVALLARRRRA